MNNKREDKVRKLLAMAEDPNCPAEARLTYAAKASELMLLWGIESLSDSRTADDIGRSDFCSGASKAYATEYAHLGIVAARQFDCRAFLIKRNGTTCLAVFGFEQDRRSAETLFTSMVLQCTAALKLFVRNNQLWHFFSRTEKENEKRAFVRGFAIGAAKALEDTKRDVLRDAPAGTDIVLSSRVAQVEAFISANVATGTVKSRSYNSSALVEGMMSGRNVSRVSGQISHAA